MAVNPGSNTIRFNPTTAGGLPNIDYVDFEVKIAQRLTPILSPHLQPTAQITSDRVAEIGAVRS